MKKITYSETFFSLQGEGEYTGTPSLWLRFFLCNLQCQGFSQSDPADPKTYDLDYMNVDLSNITKMEDLPVITKGCDSAYSWAKRFKHLAQQDDAETIAELLVEQLKNKHNPDGLFLHPSGSDTHLCFTGGEPMMKNSQQGMVDILKVLHEKGNHPYGVTVETNGTQKITSELESFIDKEYPFYPKEWFWSISPKLLNVSGEKTKRAIKPDVVKTYHEISPAGQLKFVMNNSEAAWKELDETVQIYRDAGITFPIWIMPVGAAKEQQEDESVRPIVYKALERGYNISGRLHCHLLGNGMGT